ncbi:ubiquitin-conjugating enzyme family protein [Artemisia annua]|uniref:Ubiquitin-conjugating enzyme family protein n=1 Tax=Artemisia annua TaxID=35608 RepID=A0A2U1KLJ9_ARTAN|nr:ubiquitin-conjugating enzyme family protein [Artemisia annua]
MGPEVIVIDDDPVSGDWTPKTVSRSKRKGKQKEVPYHEIIDVDMDEDPNDVVFIQGKAESNKKMKGAMGISLGSGSSIQSDSKKVPYHEIIDVDMDEDPNDVVFIQGKAESNKKMKGAMGISLGSGSSIQSDSKKVKSNTKGKLDNLRKFGNDEGMRKYENFKKFDAVVDYSEHFYSNQKSTMKQAGNCICPPKKWAKKIQEEWKILEKDLPDTIFVRVYESRMDLLRAAIIGAEGTPYHDGLFFFDVCFPSTYPQKAPLVHYHSGGLRINPNLYACGKVCLSLLNTWTGGKKEMWIPGSSTMLQVLVSIQGLILNSKPYFNEPGYEVSSGTVQEKKFALNYNENTLSLSLKTMVYTMKKQPKVTDSFIVCHQRFIFLSCLIMLLDKYRILKTWGHFRYHVRDILMACKAYTEGVQVGSLMRGGVQDVDEGQESCSYKFKTDVVSYIKFQEKRVFPGSSSSSMGPEVIVIDDDPVSGDWTPKTVSRSKRKGKQKEVPFHEIIDVDMDEDPNDVVFIQGKAKSNKKMKGAMGISLGSGSSRQSDSKKVKSNTKGKLDNLRKFVNDEGMRNHQRTGLKKYRTSGRFLKKTCLVPQTDPFIYFLEIEHTILKENLLALMKITEHVPCFCYLLKWSLNAMSAFTFGPSPIPFSNQEHTIFVRVYESRMDLLRAAIIGAEGTPYHDGLFFFDVCFPSTYPQIPPLVHYHSGGLRINPNLYNCGKVCLSLLNTWSGGAKEMWIPGTSTMLQVLVSIQGLILNNKPYFNEPGYASSSGTAQGKKYALDYNENTLILSLKTMVYTMKKQPKYFEDLVVGHFRYHVRDILMACKAYTEGVQIGSLMRGGVQDVDEGQESCSYKFKTDVVSYIKLGSDPHEWSSKGSTFKGLKTF